MAELTKKAAGCDEKARPATEPEATRLEEEALPCREWIAALRSGFWHSYRLLVMSKEGSFDNCI